MEAAILEILAAIKAGKRPLDAAWLDKLVRRHNRASHDATRRVAKRRLLPYYLGVRANDPERWKSWEVDEETERQLLSLFNASENMMAMGVVAMRKIGLHYPLAALGIILGSVFQAFAKSYYSLIVSLCRQLVVLIPAAWVLARVTGDVNQVWWCFLIAEVASAVISVLFFRKVYREVVVPLSAN